MIYFVQGQRSGMVKIGFSKNVNQRVSALRVSSPEPLRCIAIIDGTREDEEELHRRFALERSHGEWFHPRDSLHRFIERIDRGDAPPPDDQARARYESRRRHRSDAATRRKVDALQIAADAAGMSPRDYIFSVILPALAPSDVSSTFPAPAVAGG